MNYLSVCSGVEAATRINERLKADHRADFEWDSERIKQYNKDKS